MRFVDQGWKQIDADMQQPKGQSHTMAAPVAHNQISQPSLHIFTPRMRVLVQCARLNSRLTIAELSQMVGIDGNELIKIEEGRRFPSARQLDLLQTTLNIKLVPDNLMRNGAAE